MLGVLAGKTTLMGVHTLKSSFADRLIALKVKVKDSSLKKPLISDRPAIACNGPVEPFGHCCSVCGGIITFDFDGVIYRIVCRFLFFLKAFRRKDLEDLVRAEVSSTDVLRYL